MKKVFLYLYPIKEYTDMFIFHNESLYEEWGVKKPLPILNECITRRYRNNNYEVIFALYPDKEIYGIDKKENDKIIYTDVLFENFSAVDKNNNIKENFTPMYPNEEYLISQIGNVDKLIVGGYHAQDCVKRVAEKAIEMGIDTIIDLDLTDFFFHLYKEDNYFDITSYDPEKYKLHTITKSRRYGDKLAEKIFNKNYSSKAYGFKK